MLLVKVIVMMDVTHYAMSNARITALKLVIKVVTLNAQIIAGIHVQIFVGCLYFKKVTIRCMKAFMPSCNEGSSK